MNYVEKRAVRCPRRDSLNWTNGCLFALGFISKYIYIKIAQAKYKTFEALKEN